MHADERLMAPIGGVRERRADGRLPRAEPQSTGRSTGSGSGSCATRDTSEVIGRAGLRHLTIEGMAEVELAYALFPEFWGRGLATDAARACVTIGRDWLGLHSVVGLVLPANAPSQRVLRKAALRPSGRCCTAGQPHLLFRTD